MKISIPISILLCLLSAAQVQADRTLSFWEWVKRDRQAMNEWQERQQGRETDRARAGNTNDVESSESGFVSVPPAWGVAGVHYGYTPELATQEVSSVFSLSGGPETMLINTNTGELRKDDLKRLQTTFHYDASLLPDGVSQDRVKLAGFDPANPGELYILDAKRLVSRPGAAAIAGGLTLVAPRLCPP